ncbi:hypothetical protein DSECCO2_464200 [anaerobic digester metagenome]
MAIASSPTSRRRALSSHRPTWAERRMIVMEAQGEKMIIDIPLRVTAMEGYGSRGVQNLPPSRSRMMRSRAPTEEEIITMPSSPTSRRRALSSYRPTWVERILIMEKRLRVTTPAEYGSRGIRDLMTSLSCGHTRAPIVEGVAMPSSRSSASSNYQPQTLPRTSPLAPSRWSSSSRTSPPATRLPGSGPSATVPPPQSRTRSTSTPQRAPTR